MLSWSGEWWGITRVLRCCDNGESRSWKVDGELQVKRIPKYLFLFSFPSREEAVRVLKDWHDPPMGHGNVPSD